MRYLLAALLLVGCSRAPTPTPTPTLAVSATPVPSATRERPPAAAVPSRSTGGPTGAIQGVPSHRRTNPVETRPGQEGGSSAGELVQDADLPPEFKGRKVYRLVEHGRIVLKTDQGLVLSIRPMP